MKELNDIEFDLAVKNALKDAELTPPAGLWEAVEADLDKKKGLPVWLKWAGRSASAAAAVAAALVLAHYLQKPQQSQEFVAEQIEVVKTESNLLTEVLPEEEARHSEVIRHSDPEQSEGEESQSEGEESHLGEPEAAPVILSPAKQGEESHSEESINLNDEILRSDCVLPQNDEICHSESPLRGEESPERESKATGNDTPKTPVQNIFLADNQRTKTPTRTSITINGNSFGTAHMPMEMTPENPMMPRPMKANMMRIERKVITETGESSFGVPVSFGLGAKFFLHKRWAIGAGVNYTFLTRSFSGIYTPSEEAAPVEYAKIRNSQNYLGIPVNVYFSMIATQKVDFYIYLGGTAEKCVSNTYKMAPGIIHKDPVKGFQFSAGGGLGFEYILAKTVGLYIDPSIRYYFKDKNQPKSIRTQNPLSYGCEIGVRVRI